MHTETRSKQPSQVRYNVRLQLACARFLDFAAPAQFGLADPVKPLSERFIFTSSLPHLTPIALLGFALLISSRAQALGATPSPQPQSIDPVCTTEAPAGGTQTMLIFETLEIDGRPLDFPCVARTQFQPDEDPKLPTYRWECGSGRANEAYFLFYIRGLTEAGKVAELKLTRSDHTLGVDFEDSNPGIAMHFHTPRAAGSEIPAELRNLSADLWSEASAVQNFTTARVAIKEHRALGRRGNTGELRFVRGCAEFRFESASISQNSRDRKLPPAQFRFFFQGELEEFGLIRKAGT